MSRRSLVATLCTIVAALYVSWRLSAVDWDPVGIFELGSQYTQGDPQGSEGYDGQFTYFIAVEPDPAAVAPRLDVPAYRYQRILLPLLGRLLALGRLDWIPWALIVVNLAGHWIGTRATAGLLASRGVSAWFAVGYGLWVGLVAPVGIGLAEPLTYGLTALGLLAWVAHRRPVLGVALIGLAGLAKEPALLFLVALLAAEISGRRRREVLAAIAGVAGAHLLWQLWLLATFGTLGIGSGGALATGFELIPFMGLLRIGEVNLAALALFVLVFGPSVVLPTVWGVWNAMRDWRRGERGVEVYAVLVNGLAVMVLPFSTFREPLGLVRFADGLVLSLLLYVAARGLQRPLRYSLLWAAWLALLLNR